MLTKNLKTSSGSIAFNVDSWKVSINHRKNKVDRMKLVIKLNKEETEGFENFFGAVCPKGVSKEDFAKVIFFNGVEKLNEEFATIAKEYSKTVEDQKEVVSAEENPTEETDE